MKGHCQNLRKHPLPSIDDLRAAFVYVPETGLLWRRYKRCSKLAGFRRADGYLAVRFGGGDRFLLMHRVAVAMMCGYWPDMVDHLDGNRSNNRWQNLRPTTNSVNGKNRFRERRSVRERQGRYALSFRKKQILFARRRDAERFLFYITEGQARLGAAFVPVIPSRSERLPKKRGYR